jgi:hypothetical protein
MIECESPDCCNLKKKKLLTETVVEAGASLPVLGYANYKEERSG